ncbi:MAG: hypothetical protein ACFCU8_20540, partial [Thermosynechococcaceae cyanobacterium]
DKSDILSFANGDSGGGIEISSNLLQISEGSSISVNSLGVGSGGNILVNSDLVILDSGSSIVANSVDARGGNITINTSGLINNRNAVVTASSAQGETLNGTVIFNTPNIDLQKGLTILDTAGEAPKITTVCNSTGQENTLTIAGSGGSPVAKEDYTDSRIKFYSKGVKKDEPLIYTDPTTGEKKELKRMVGWKLSEDGTKFSLVSDPEESVQYKAAKTACLREQPV